MDDLKKKGADDRSKINMSEAWEVDFWTNELGVSKDELQKVINKVGNSTAAVRRELGQSGLLVRGRARVCPRSSERSRARTRANRLQ